MWCLDYGQFSAVIIDIIVIMEDYIAAIIGIIVIVVVLFLILFLPILILSLWSNDFTNKDKYVEADVQLHGKTAIVTGSSKGTGAMTAKELARRGARVILAVRNVKKTKPIRDEIIKETGNEQVKIKQVDLSDLESVHRFCWKFNENEKDLHILINNAGLASSSERTKQGFNMVMSVNYMAPFVLTHLLLDKMKQSAPSQIISLNSHMPFVADAIPCMDHIHLDLMERDDNGTRFLNLNDKRDSCLYSIMMIKELSNRLKGTGVTCYSVTPGVVFTGQGGPATSCLNPLFKAISRDEWTGSQSILYCTLQENIEDESGSMLDNRHTHVLPKLARRDNVARDFYDATLRVVPNNFTCI